MRTRVQNGGHYCNNTFYMQKQIIIPINNQMTYNYYNSL